MPDVWECAGTVDTLIYWRITIHIFVCWRAFANLSSSKSSARFYLQISVLLLFFTIMPFFNKGIILFSYGRSTHFCLFVNILHIKYSTIVHLSLKWNMACNRVSGIKMIRFWGFLYYWVMPIREKLLWDEKCVLCLFLSIFYSVINQ